MNQELETPVILFIYNRPQATRRVFARVRQARPRELLIVADGPRAERVLDGEACAAARAVVEAIDWECDVARNYAPGNMGLKQRIDSGMSWAFERVDEALILEDDCLPDPSFFPFCAELLARYREDERLMSVCGSNFQFGRGAADHSYHFSRYPLIWGWATWRRAWQHYQPTMGQWPALKEAGWLNDFLSPAAARYWSYNFSKNYDNLATWDYAWIFSCWLRNGISVVPSGNLVKNIGFGEGATHTLDQESVFANLPLQTMDFPLQHPPEVRIDEEADAVTEASAFSGHEFLGPLFRAIRAQLNTKGNQP